METKAGVITKFEPMDVIAVNGTDCLVADAARNLNEMLELVRRGASAETLALGMVSLYRADGSGYPTLRIDHLGLFRQLSVGLSNVR